VRYVTTAIRWLRRLRNGALFHRDTLWAVYLGVRAGDCGEGTRGEVARVRDRAARRNRWIHNNAVVAAAGLIDVSVRVQRDETGSRTDLRQRRRRRARARGRARTGNGRVAHNARREVRREEDSASAIDGE